MPGLSRNAQVLRYLLDVAPGVGHTLLAKFAYLADLAAREYVGSPISEMRYRYDNHGPFDAVAFYSARDELLEGGFITEEDADIGGYAGFELRPTDRVVTFEFADWEAEILSFVGRKFASWTARELCDRKVYASLPMKNAVPGRLLDMDQVNREPEELEFNLERLLAGKRSADEQRARPLADVLHELRARHIG